MRDPFWQSATILLDYKRQLCIALIGALISAACFGAGLGMLPTVTLLLNKDDESVAQSKTIDRLESPEAPPHAHEAARWLREHPTHDTRTPLQRLIDRHLMHKDRPQAVQSLGRWVYERLPSDPLNGFLLIMALIGVLTVIGSIGRYIHEFIVVTIVFKAGQQWRSRVFGRLIHAPLDQAMRQGYADNMSRLIADTTLLANGYQSLMGKAVAELLKGAAALVVALVINPWLTMLALILAPVIAVMLRRFGKRIRRASRKALQARGRMLAMLNESLGALMVVKVHDAEGYERRRFHRVNRSLVAQQMKARRAKALASPVVETLALFGVMVGASIAAFLIYRQGFAAMDLIFVLACLAAAGGSVKPLSSLNNDLNEAGAAATRVLEALALPVEPTGTAARSSLPDAPRHAREVLFDNVSYTYPGKETPAINGVTLRVEHGRTTAVVGGNGAGKTTLLSLLPRLIEPAGGRVTIDGVDIKGVNLRTLRAQLAVVTQQSQLFEGTIAENIAYGRRQATREQIIIAAQAAFADEFIRALPLGYDMELAEGGAGLSGGQRQRICIARAVLRDPSILILDEATSQIDADSEAKIAQALRALRRGRTTFIVAHRLSTVIDADCIVVMGDGRIIDQGTHDELLTRCEVYKLLTQTQLQNAR